MSTQFKICFVALNGYPVLKGGANFMGGAELQQSYLGAELASRGHQVSFITMDHGQGAEEKIGNVRAIASFIPKEGIPGLRFFWPRLYKVWKALANSDADIFYVRCAGYLLAVVVFFARKHHKKVVYCCANDPEFDPKKIELHNFRDKWMFYWGLRRCDAVVVQNNLQKRLLKENFNREGVVIPNGFPSSEEPASPENILWVASFKKFKRPEIFVELAKIFPQENFVMVGGSVSSNKEAYESLKKESQKVPNLRFCGHMPLSDAEKEFSMAKALINTSIHEGFPNTFLQAWRKGVPVLSFVDPDNLIQSNQLGYVATDMDDMKGKMNQLLRDSSLMSQNIRSYFEANLTISAVVDSYEKFFLELMRKPI